MFFSAGISEEDRQRFGQSDKFKTGNFWESCIIVRCISTYDRFLFDIFSGVGGVAKLGRKHRVSIYPSQEVQI
jgi:hypothetical protein